MTQCTEGQRKCLEEGEKNVVEFFLLKRAQVGSIVKVSWVSPLSVCSSEKTLTHHQNPIFNLFVSSLCLSWDMLPSYLPGPRLPPESNRPNRKMTALSYSWTTCNKVCNLQRFEPRWDTDLDSTGSYLETHAEGKWERHHNQPPWDGCQQPATKTNAIVCLVGWNETRAKSTWVQDGLSWKRSASTGLSLLSFHSILSWLSIFNWRILKNTFCLAFPDSHAHGHPITFWKVVWKVGLLWEVNSSISSQLWTKKLQQMP